MGVCIEVLKAQKKKKKHLKTVPFGGLNYMKIHYMTPLRSDFWFVCGSVDFILSTAFLEFKRACYEYILKYSRTSEV